MIQRIENFCPFHPGFDALIRHGALSRWTAALMGGPVVLFKDKINFKMPGGPGFKAHQDQQAGWTRYAPLFVTALVTIDPATLENGCLEMVPGRHREGLIGEEWNPLDETGLALQPVPTEPGDVIFFDSFAPHASKPNFTDQPRRILYLTYNLASEGDHRAHTTPKSTPPSRRTSSGTAARATSSGCSRRRAGQLSAEIVGEDEVGEAPAEQVVGVVVEALNGCGSQTLK